jgi:hypothetical protein
MALSERLELVPAEFLVIPTDGPIGGVGDSLGPPLLDHLGMSIDDQTSLIEVVTTDSKNNNNELNIANLHHPNFPERNLSPPEPSSSEPSLGGIGESPSLSSRTRVERTRTGTMVFAEAEANTVTDGLAAREG